MPLNMKAQIRSVDQWEQEGKMSNAVAAELRDAFKRMDKNLDRLRIFYSNEQAGKDFRTIRDFVLANAGRGITFDVAGGLAENLDSLARSYESDGRI